MKLTLQFLFIHSASSLQRCVAIVQQALSVVLLFLREIKKKLWLDSNRWDHDRFDLSKQGPKSREELVDSYGYDIRAHSKPPDSVPFLNNRGRLVDLITYVLV